MAIAASAPTEGAQLSGAEGRARTGQLRASAHSDYGSLAILKTEDRPGGLQVLAGGRSLARTHWLAGRGAAGCSVTRVTQRLETAP